MIELSTNISNYEQLISTDLTAYDAIYLGDVTCPLYPNNFCSDTKDLENAIHNNPDKDFHGAVLASDAFFPFSDCAQVADEAGIKAIVQPGGSVRDQESIDYCDEHDMTMVFNGYRHFRH